MAKAGRKALTAARSATVRARQVDGPAPEASDADAPALKGAVNVRLPGLETAEAQLVVARAAHDARGGTLGAVAVLAELKEEQDRARARWERITERAVRQGRRAGLTWDALGMALGVTGEALRKKYARALR